MNIAGVRRGLANRAGRHAHFFWPLYMAFGNKKGLLVQKNYQIVIEGYPRSANTYSVLAFERAQPTEVLIAHHLHVPAQLILAARWNIPAIVLLRDPTDAISSLLIREPAIPVFAAIAEYYDFYETLMPYWRSLLWVRFETVTQDIGTVVRSVNSKYSTNFVPPTVSDDERQKIFEDADALEKTKDELRVDERRVSRPSSFRTLEKEKLLLKICQESDGKPIARARAAYNRCVANAM